MTDEQKDVKHDEPSAKDVSRRDFVTMSLSAGLVAATGSLASAADLPVTETMVEITTPDGVCEAAFSHPTTGSHPAVLMWTDGFGLRPVMRDMGRRMAAAGFSVLVPNPFYRVTKIPALDMTTFNLTTPADREKLTSLIGSIAAQGAAERDAVAFVAFLDAQRSVNTARKIGTQGYCMGGPLVMRTAAALPDRVGAGGSFHGGGLVTDQPTSPHLLVPKMKARMYIAIASNDDERQPDAKDTLRAAFAAANVPAEIEVYQSLHGWCVPGARVEAGRPIYNQPEAEKAWAKLLALYKTALG